LLFFIYYYFGLAFLLICYWFLFSNLFPLSVCPCL
jgi:hypothetical protein